MGFGLRALNAKFVRENRRSAPRHRYTGNDTWIRPEGSLSRLCQVLDLSRTGVRLALTSAHRLPDTFTLILSKNNGGCRLARVKWRRGTELGAEFIKVDSSSVSRLPADAPRANPSSASSLTVDAPRRNSSKTMIADAPRAQKRREDAAQRSENLMATASLCNPVQEPDTGKLKVDLGSIAGSKAKSEAQRQTTDISGQVDRVEQEMKSKKRMDLSRLQKKLGPKHVALIDAVKDLDPESPHGRELASIIESLDETCGSQRTI